MSHVRWSVASIIGFQRSSGIIWLTDWIRGWVAVSRLVILIAWGCCGLYGCIKGVAFCCCGWCIEGVVFFSIGSDERAGGGMTLKPSRDRANGCTELCCRSFQELGKRYSRIPVLSGLLYFWRCCCLRAKLFQGFIKGLSKTYIRLKETYNFLGIYNYIKKEVIAKYNIYNKKRNF